MLPFIWECADKPFKPLNANTISVSFCGLSYHHREKTLELFESEPGIECNFIRRSSFWGGAPGDEQLIKEYNENIRNSQFVLCDRGAGNFSMRFYQALAFGRIPVVVNTDMFLPFSEKIDWKNTIVFENSPEECLKQCIRTFESSLCIDYQRRCAEAHKNFFAHDVVFNHLYEYFIRDLL